MAVERRLAFSIVQFLRDQTHRGALNSDEQESLEVAIQCLETTFRISSSERHLAVTRPLAAIFTSSLLTNDNLSAPESSPSPEDMERAEQLKNEGNNHMKEENYRCAVECYTAAIDLDLRNAVYYCNRAAAHSKLGSYRDATADCERAIGIDPAYSKAYGRMGLALTAMTKYPEAITHFKKALVLDPDNDTYKANLKVVEQKQKEASSPREHIAAGLGFDMASLINNPAFISMAASVMQNQQVQQLMSGMMSNAVGGPAAGVGGLSDISSLIEAGQQFAQQIQQQNPELIEQLRNHIRSRSFSAEEDA
ncbi:small glutamine-rich tetratricopeptide repeat-containing protein beta [Pseudoliparis swirei]|uniref:small glutamine-rich tetratricopeptide repeat-containing protein beta n=1 Tax=Pseudoliparis swirei TaxID=2059687 RepID=UPI0024BED6E7|nr:small glutamine-rich tetratricopeptide repeat-containing protein beta [Pseudoliparis swirei]XP_056290077.1 small glutamine-rich tetratricopeptide repeat-containing protein beta [Pseudoliparis swirei]